MRSDLLVVSNNPLVWEWTDSPCQKIAGTALEVLYACISLIGSSRHSLYAHPLAGNARLLHNPFRTVVLMGAGGDLQPERQAADLRQLEYFTQKMEALGGLVPESTLKDYRTVDFELFKGV